MVEPSVNDDGRKRTDKILVIDDDEAALRLMKRRLEHDGYANVIVTALPRLGLELFESSEPDLLILDLNMPDMDGFEVLKALRNMHPEQLAKTPVLVLTGEGIHEKKLQALSLGARDFLAKPFDPAELAIRVSGNLEVRGLMRRITKHSEELDLKVRVRTAELEKANFEIIHRLMAAAEYRDDDTGSHIQRMSLYAELVARAMGLPDEECESILKASPMHDLGKIGIPDSILLKPGKLTSEEWEIMKSHTTIGASLLSNGSSELIQLAEVIALTHHEKWNGQGYPKGLKETEIPLAGRIVAVCDVFDALTSERPYKSAWEVSRALEVIRGDSGSHFDPLVVESFFEVLPQILQIKDEFKDARDAKEALKTSPSSA
jgi:putative two-component system response regulator